MNTFSSTELNVTIIAQHISTLWVFPGELGPNEFIAGIYLILRCIVHGESDSRQLNYDWSLTNNIEIGECFNCDTQFPTKPIFQHQLYSYLAGTYTCTVSERGSLGSENSANFIVKAVGKIIAILL